MEEGRGILPDPQTMSRVRYLPTTMDEDVFAWTRVRFEYRYWRLDSAWQRLEYHLSVFALLFPAHSVILLLACCRIMDSGGGLHWLLSTGALLCYSEADIFNLDIQTSWLP